MERWREPATIVAVEDDPTRIIHDGKVFRRQVNVTVAPETLARMRLGYVCLRCWEPQEQAMPHACSLCGYSIRALQTQDIASEFDGVKQIGPGTSVEDELERMRERRERSRVWTPPHAA